MSSLGRRTFFSSFVRFTGQMNSKIETGENEERKKINMTKRSGWYERFRRLACESGMIHEETSEIGHSTRNAQPKNSSSTIAMRL
jgi:hypothetical protein